MIYHEDLRVANMVQNHHLAKSISDAGWSAFLTILAFKAASAGKRVHSGQSRVHQPAMFGAGCGVDRPEGLIRPLACVPGVWNQPASGPQRRAEHLAAGPREAVGGDTAVRRQREPLGCA